jgi:hypothetical protein
MTVPCLLKNEAGGSYEHSVQHQRQKPVRNPLERILLIPRNSVRMSEIPVRAIIRI